MLKKEHVQIYLRVCSVSEMRNIKGRGERKRLMVKWLQVVVREADH